MMARLFRVEIRFGVASRMLQLERVTAQVAMEPFLFRMVLLRLS